jgi:hypothetical protein
MSERRDAISGAVFKIGAKLQKIFELSAQFDQKNAKKLSFLSR